MTAPPVACGPSEIRPLPATKGNAALGESQLETGTPELFFGLTIRHLQSSLNARGERSPREAHRVQTFGKVSWMRIESSVTAISWIPSEAIEGMTRLPFDMGLFHYDDPPADHIASLDELHKKDAFREANELRAWIVVEDGKITSYGHAGRGLLGTTRLKIGPKKVAFPG